ncbi:hypothetical protein J4731_13765 [Providencia rettgeri]|nr:hypothetical protein [Providencia rettgeri]
MIINQSQLFQIFPIYKSYFHIHPINSQALIIVCPENSDINIYIRNMFDESPSSKLKPKLPNSLLLSTAIWSTAILPMVPSYAQIVHLDDLPTLGGQAIQFEGTQPEDSTERF